MKTATILFFVFAYFQVKVLAQPFEGSTEIPPLEAEELECVKELKLNEMEIQRLNNLEIAPDNNFAYNKYMACYFKKMGWQDNNGKIDYDSLRTAMADEVVEEYKKETPASRMLLKQIMLSLVTECEESLPRGGYNHGLTVVRAQNCVMQKINAILGYD